MGVLHFGDGDGARALVGDDDASDERCTFQQGEHPLIPRGGIHCQINYGD